MKIRYLIPALIIIVVVVFVTCRRSGHRNMDQGEIYYSIKYIRNPSSFSEEVLPRDMVIAFKDNKVYTQFTTVVGNTGVSTVMNPRKNIYDTYVNLMAFKFCYRGTPENPLTGFSSMQNIRYRETGREKDICGFRCHEVEALFPGMTTPRSVWYTKEIDVKNPNILNPFHQIDGVLMDFFFIIGDAELRFEAQEVYAREVPEKYFERKKNYKSVSEGYLDTLIRKMITF